MENPMSPSQTITPGQIAKIQELIGAGLRKSGLSRDATQLLLERRGKALIAELMAIIIERINAVVIDIIVRHVKVKRNRSPQEVIDATGCSQNTDRQVVDDMPHGENGEVDVYFFQVPRSMRGHSGVTEFELERKYANHNLKPADPYSLAQVNTDDPTFADEHPNATYWKDPHGSICLAFFYKRGFDRLVGVERCSEGQFGNDFWWFAGVRK